MKASREKRILRPPVIVIMGHIDHGKSTLLDYVRHTNTAETEAGGITQRLSAYEVIHSVKDTSDSSGKAKKEQRITFLDTPGHEAFQKMRFHGAEVADIAVLIVSAEDGVKAQTLEALESIIKSKTPYIVAINKIDKPAANVERTKTQLTENNVYLEGLGGDVPWVAVSAKKGDGVTELLDLMLLVAELEELTGDRNKPAEGVVIEAHRDPQKGISATLIVKDGTIKNGMYVVSGESTAPVRIMENFQGKRIAEASFSSPIRIVGFNSLPEAGETFSTYKLKKDAEKAVQKPKQPVRNREEKQEQQSDMYVVPLILKADAAGSLDAIKHEIGKLDIEGVEVQVVQTGVGTISENDVKFALGNKRTLIVGFNTKIDGPAHDLADRSNIQIATFDIIYNLSKWLEEELEKQQKVGKTEIVTGKASVLKTFSRTKNKQVIGGAIEEGALSVRNQARIMRKETEIGRAKILNLQQNKADTKRVESGEFGAQIESAIEIAPGDKLETLTGSH